MQSLKIPSFATSMEEFKALPEGTLAELINGKLFMSPSPVLEHQRISADLITDINLFVRKNKKGGRVFHAACDVYLDDVANVVQPDIIYVSPENRLIMKEDAIHGTPDLLIEILSPSNASHDLNLKKDLYENFGIQEYWIVSPKTGECNGYRLQDGKYGEPLRLKNKLEIAVLGHQVFEF
jgi:Uma2 family endonuclease